MILDTDDVHVSAATLWVIAIKHPLGRGDMPVSSAQALQAFKDAGYALLAVKPEHAVRVEGWPGIHNDPLDRILVAQAFFEPLTLSARVVVEWINCSSGWHLDADCNSAVSVACVLRFCWRTQGRQ